MYFYFIYLIKHNYDLDSGTYKLKNIVYIKT